MKYCTFFFTESAKHTFFGGATATECKVELSYERPGYYCYGYASPPNDAGCLFSTKLTKR